MENDDPNPPTYKACSQCKRLDVPYHDSRKSCERCRAKARKRFQDKKRALTAQLASLNSTSSIQTQLHLPPPQTAKRKIEETRNTPRKVSKQSVPATVSVHETYLDLFNVHVSCYKRPTKLFLFNTRKRAHFMKLSRQPLCPTLDVTSPDVIPLSIVTPLTTLNAQKWSQEIS